MKKQSQWRYTGQSVIGTSHTKSGLPCQDAHGIECIGDMLVAVLADGAGSAKHSDSASALIVEETLAVVRNWETFPEDETVWRRQVFELTENLRAQLQQKAEQEGYSLKELSATMLLCIVSGDTIAAMQIGDGAIVIGGEEEGNLSLLTTPDQGEYLNQTVFLTSKEYQQHLQTVYLYKPISEIVLFSDGLQMQALNMSGQSPVSHVPFFLPFFEFLRTVDDAEQRNVQLQEFLKSPRVCSRTDDDKTLIIALRQA